MSTPDDVRARLGDRGYRYWLLGQVVRYLPADPDDADRLKAAYWYLARLVKGVPADATTPPSPSAATSPVSDPRLTTITHPGVAGDVTETVSPAAWSQVVYPGDLVDRDPAPRPAHDATTLPQE
jgi:hypothetical protein